MQKFKDFNLRNNIPIMGDQTIDTLYHQFDNLSNAKVLEIGTAYGYSAMYLSKHKNISKIITLEKDTERFAIAKQQLAANTKVLCVNCSAFDYQIDDKYDCIIIDGPKTNQEMLFDKYSKYLSDNGIIFIDNLNLFQNTNKEMTKNRLKLKNKVETFKQYISNLKDWKVMIYEIDDGFAIIRK